MVRSQGYRKRPYERVEHWMDNAITFPSVPRYQLMNFPVVVEAMIEGFRVRRIHVDGGSSSKVIYPMGVIDLEVTIGECGKTRTVIMEFAVVKSPSLYNALLDPTLIQTSSKVANPRLSLAPVETRPQRPGKEPMQLDGTEGRRQLDKGRRLPKYSVEEKIVINDNYPEQLITIGGGLSAECRHALIHTLLKNVDIFAWTPADMTGIPRVITEHSLDTYPHNEPKAQKKRSLAPDRRKVVTDEVNKWLKADIVRRVRYLTWVANPVLVKKMKKKDEEKTAFHTKEGVFCYTKMPFGLKNVGATYQRLVDYAFKEQIGVNLEAINMKLNPKKCSFAMEEGKFLGYVVTSEGIRANPEKAKDVMDMPSPKTLKQMQSLSGKLAALNQAAEVAFLEMKKLVSELPTLITPKKGETLIRYLAAANETVSAVLLTERNGRQMLIHYVSRSLQRAETNYAPMEKLALALVHAARRLRRGIWHNVHAKGSNKGLGLSRLSSRHSNRDKFYSRGSGVGLILIAPDDVEYSYALCLNFSNSNNDAEYEALLAGLRIAKEMQVRDIHAFMDSKLVASQVKGSYEANGERLIKYQEKVLELAGAFNRFRITHIPRAENRKADALSKRSDLNDPEDPVDARTLMEKIGNYTIEDGVLYRKSYLVSLMRCVGPLQANYVIREVHMGSCGMHDGPRVVAKAMNLGHFWPSMHRDARELIRVCNDCQAHAAVPRLPKADMISVTSAWLFMKWGMDIVGPLPEGPGRVKYLIMAIDYFTKWMEAKPLATITGKQVVNFAYDNIVYRFRILATIVTDNGTQFVNDPFKIRKRANKAFERIKTDWEKGRDQLGLRRCLKCELGPTWEGPYKVDSKHSKAELISLSNMEGEEIPRIGMLVTSEGLM
ncbi:reverse transcriptase domain-containing protein [Tanacetum coccineum]